MEAEDEFPNSESRVLKLAAETVAQLDHATAEKIAIGPPPRPDEGPFGPFMCCLGLAILGGGAVIGAPFGGGWLALIVGLVMLTVFSSLCYLLAKAMERASQRPVVDRRRILAHGWMLGDGPIFWGNWWYPKESPHEVTEFFFPLIGVDAKLYRVIRTETITQGAEGKARTKLTCRVEPLNDIGVLDWHYTQGKEYGNEVKREIDSIRDGRREDCPEFGDGLVQALRLLLKKE